MAIACGGCVDRNRIAARLETVRTQTEALAKLSDVVIGVRAENKAINSGGEASGYNDLLLLIAIWSDQSDRAEGWAVASSRAWFGSSYRPFELVAIDQASSPPVPAEMLTRCYSGADAVAVLSRQREYVETDGSTIVGGWGELTTVGREGIEQTRVIEWPDAIGRAIGG